MNNEFSGMILAELTLEATLVDQLLETNILDVVFIRMLSADPDTQKHSLQVSSHSLSNYLYTFLAHAI